MKPIAVFFIIIMETFVISQDDRFASLREKMVIEQIESRGVTDEGTLMAMRKVPRHKFIPEDYADRAYNDSPLPIGYSQTISQPYIVALMTEAVKPGPRKRALEIGTGSGYQAAVLGELVKEVYTIEIVPELAKESSERLKKMGYANVFCKHGDGYAGWPEKSPFDIIIVTAAPEEIPQPLIDQLAENGRLIIPVGPPSSVQELILAEKKNGRISRRNLTFVRFVPFLRQEQKD